MYSAWMLGEGDTVIHALGKKDPIAHSPLIPLFSEPALYFTVLSPHTKPIPTTHLPISPPQEAPQTTLTLHT